MHILSSLIAQSENDLYILLFTVLQAIKFSKQKMILYTTMRLNKRLRLLIKSRKTLMLKNYLSAYRSQLEAEGGKEIDIYDRNQNSCQSRNS
jgi:hypothetical protein